MKAVELFTGAGGLAMGSSMAGFSPEVVVEWDQWACDTIRENQRRGFPLAQNWPLVQGDVRRMDWSGLSRGVDLLAAGPPCQPFSMGGSHRSFGDERDMFPVTVEAVQRLEPKAFIIENVKGLTRSSFADYYQYILLRLEFPSVGRRENESWEEHLSRLQQEKTSGGLHQGGELTYHVVPTLVNAANYGVPQQRERVFIVGFRSDLGVEWSFPQPTNDFNSLLKEQWITGEYWERHGIPTRRRPSPPSRWEKRIARIHEGREEANLRPWRTVRDALVDIPDPRDDRKARFRNHHFQDGAKVYPGHTGSPLDLPAKTLKAGDHGVPGGENMMVRDGGDVRYFTVRESARLQTFPDGYVFHGAWSETMRQLGNAVPVALGRVVAGSVASRLAECELRRLTRSRNAGRAMA